MVLLERGIWDDLFSAAFLNMIFAIFITQLFLQVFQQWCVVIPVLQSGTQLRTMP